MKRRCKSCILRHLYQECPTYGLRATIWPDRRFYPAREVFLILSHCFNGCELMLQKCQNGRFVSIRCVFHVLKYAKLVFCQGSAPDPAGGAYDAPLDPLIGWVWDTPSPFPFTLDAFGILISAPWLSGPRLV